MFGPIVPRRPSIVALPSVSGDPTVGATLSVGSFGTWADANGFSQKWRRCTADDGCVDIPGATGTTYVASAADVGSRLMVSVMASNATGSTWASSFWTAVVAAPSGGGGGTPPPGGGGGGGGGGAGLADLKLTGSVSPASAAVGETLEWRLQLQNPNGALAEGAFVDVLLPSGVTLVSAQTDRGPGCTHAPVSWFALRCRLDFLNENAKIGNIVIATRVNAAGELVLSATGGYSLKDPTPADLTVTLKANTPSAAPTPPPAPPRTPAVSKGVTKSGSAKGDRLVGTRFADVLRGLAGNDTLLGLEGNDYLVGGAGKDTVRAGAGNDSVAARDRTRDVISCGAGKDTVVADRIDAVARDCETVRRA
jgi:Ca2+-binding RTX toxin-like protein